jgi:hypothetical protein
LALPIIIGFVFLGLDYASALAAREGLQRAADAAALSGARQMMVASPSSKFSALSLAEAEVKAGVSAAAALQHGSVRVVASLDDLTRAVTVEVFAETETLLAEHVLGRPVRVNARARAMPLADKSMCVMAIEESGVVLRVSGNGGIRANGCVVHANSTHAQALTLAGAAHINAHSICSVGGYRGSANAMSPAPTTDCPAIEDPLMDRDPPTEGACTFTGKSINHVSQTWTPGIYCGGMYLNNGAKVTLSPGVYVLRGGTLNIEGGASLKGEGVTIVLTQGARLNVLANSELDLSAPATGPTAGLLLFGDRDAPSNSAHQFRSNKARNMLGTIYLPAAELRIGGGAPIADKSPWTAVVAGSLQVDGAAEIVLNTNFDATDVPLPSGLDGRARNLRLLD